MTKKKAKGAARGGTSPKPGDSAKGDGKAKAAAGKRATPAVNAPPGTAGDWRGAMLAEVRRMIQEADPEIVEERKWVKPTNPAGVPVWSHAGIVCTGETYKQVVKVTFFKGAALDDPKGLFNSSLEGNARRAIDIREGETIDAEAFKTLIQAAVAENLGGGSAKPQGAPKATAKKKAKSGG